VHDTGEVDQLASQIDARVDGLSQPMLACTALSAEDLAAWKSFYFSWKTLSIYWTNLRANSGIINSMQGLFDVEGLIGTSIYDQMYRYKEQLDSKSADSWPSRLNKACPGTYAPPPDIVLPPPPLPSPSTDWGSVAQNVLTAAIAVSTAVVLYKGLAIVEDFTSRARK
jgi:hypothetical protein